MPAKNSMLAALALSVVSSAVLAQPTGSLTYAPDPLAISVPISTVLLVPLGLLVALVGLLYLRKHGAGHVLGFLLSSIGVAAAIAAGAYVHNATAVVPIVELSNPQGGTVGVSVGDHQYKNTSGIPLIIVDVSPPAPYCTSGDAISKCVRGLQLPVEGVCETSYTCVPPPTVSITNAVNGIEATSPSNGSFTITRTGDTSGPLAVSFTLNGTATGAVAGTETQDVTDYTVPSLTGLTIPAGQASADLVIAVLPDTVNDPGETVVLTIEPAADYTVGATGTSAIKIFGAGGLSLIWVPTGTEPPTNFNFGYTFGSPTIPAGGVTTEFELRLSPASNRAAEITQLNVTFPFSPNGVFDVFQIGPASTPGAVTCAVGLVLLETTPTCRFTINADPTRAVASFGNAQASGTLVIAAGEASVPNRTLLINQAANFLVAVNPPSPASNIANVFDFTVTLTAQARAVISAIGFAAPEANIILNGGTCGIGTILNPADSCTVIVRFALPEGATDSANLLVSQGTFGFQANVPLTYTNELDPIP